MCLLRKTALPGTRRRLRKDMPNAVLAIAPIKLKGK